VEQIAGRMLVCGKCGKDIGFVGGAQRHVAGEAESRIAAGTAGRCSVCQQGVEVKSNKSVAPHYRPGERASGPGKGEPAAPVAHAPGASPVGRPLPAKLAAHMTRDVLKVISCTRGGDARIEVLTLEYLDKSERVRIQIEALRDMLGHVFRMADYPTVL